MKHQQKKIIFCKNKSESEVIEQLRNELSKKCDLFIDGHTLVLTSRAQQAVMQSGYAPNDSVPVNAQISATISPISTGSMVTIVLEKPAISCKCIMLILLLGLFFMWFIACAFNITSMPSIPTEYGLLQLIVFLGGVFFIAHSTDRMMIAQKIQLVRNLENALKQS